MVTHENITEMFDGSEKIKVKFNPQPDRLLGLFEQVQHGNYQLGIVLSRMNSDMP